MKNLFKFLLYTIESSTDKSYRDNFRIKMAVKMTAKCKIMFSHTCSRGLKSIKMFRDEILTR